MIINMNLSFDVYTTIFSLSLFLYIQGVGMKTCIKSYTNISQQPLHQIMWDLMQNKE